MLKVLLSLTVFTVSFLAPHDADAAIAAKLGAVSVKRAASGVTVDLAFDRPVLARALKPSLERDFVQIVLKGTKMDSAKMLAATDSEVQKVFVYPYSPETVRLRLILRRDSQWARGRISVWNNNPKSVRIFIKEPLAAHASAAASAETPVARQAITGPVALRGHSAPLHPISPLAASVTTDGAPGGGGPGGAGAAVGLTDSNEKKLLSEVVSNTHDIDINNPDSVKAALAPAAAPPAAVSAVDKTTTLSGDALKTGDAGPIGISSGIAADPTRHFARMAAALFGVLALFIGLAFVVKKYAGKLKKLPFGKKERLIQVVATHYLGNKKSISLVKITGEYMVVGVSNDGISLISKLAAETNVEKYIEDRFWNGTFEKHLDSYSGDAVSSKQPDAIGLSGLSGYDGVKDLAASVKDEVQIESPVRASIREKLTKLKPLA